MIELHSIKFEILSGPGDLFNERLLGHSQFHLWRRSDLDNVVPY